MSFVKGATSCVWLHELEHGHCQRQLQSLLETEHLWLRTLLHGSLRSLLHCSHWWTHHYDGVTAENVVIQRLSFNDCQSTAFYFSQVLLLEPTFLVILRIPPTPFQRWISGTPFLLSALHSYFQGTLLAIAGTYVTYMYFGLQVSWQKYWLQLMFLFFRPALSLQIRPAVWRRSTFSSMAKVTWMTPSYVTLLGIRLSTVRHLSFRNGWIALTKLTINEMFTRPSLRWDQVCYTIDIPYETGWRG